MRFALAALLLTSAAVAQDAAPAYDKAALAPILSHSWAEGACDAPASLVDWVIDEDGWAYERSFGFTPLKDLAFADGKLRVLDEVGIGSTERIYWMREDGALRLWSEIFDEGDAADGAGPPMQRVKDGKILIGPDGLPPDGGTGEETPALMPCPARTALYDAATVAALEGLWADKAGGSCADGVGTLRFALTRPVPRVFRGDMGEMAGGDMYASAIVKDGDAWLVTESGAFDAMEHRFVPGAGDTLTQESSYEGEPVRVFARCKS